jgi:subtilisin family serine protease
VSDWVKKHTTYKDKATNLSPQKCLSDYLNIWKVRFDFTRIHEGDFLSEMRNDPEVVVAQYNHLLKRRSKVPDDPFFSMQWQWLNEGTPGLADADIDADDAWQISTGGVSALGDTIVVALIDNGVDYMHPDLAGNIWFNRNEIPGNGIDDDENGFVDDYRGWNVNLSNDNIEPELFGGGVQDAHGTEILGVMAASGNNATGVAGVNWNLKVMNVTLDLSLEEASMIESYSYILAQRKLYNETDGARGAYVVATNLSYGDEDLLTDDAPIWCSFYDSLGAQGILNCAATANQELDIDSIQDVPTSCPSDFLISVTASDDQDVRSFAAFGKNDIDLAAPGDRIFTTYIPDYNFSTGTSYASPMVTGVIALLYSSPCADLASLSKSDPAAAALQARSYILETVDQVPALADDVATGGRLNAFNALNQTLQNCSSCIAPFDINISEENGETTVSWNESDSVDIVELRYRLLGDTIWNMLDTAVSPHLLGALGNCNTYELELSALCQDSSIATSPTIVFSSEICCSGTSSLFVDSRTEESAVINWDTVEGSLGYNIRYSSTDTIIWLELSGAEPSIELDSLLSCSEYVIQVQVQCDTGLTAYSDTLLFMTMGCGACLDSVYCPVIVEGISEEYIDSFALHTLMNASGQDGGYGDYTGAQSTQLKQGSRYGMEIFPGFEGDQFDEHYWTWIDFDQDGNFDNDEELVYSSDTAVAGAVSTVIQIPEDAPLGLTRMRVLMLFEPTQDTIFGCNTIVDFGEVEDYCVEIIFDSLLCPPTPMIDTLAVGAESIDITWTRVDSAIGYTIRYRKAGDEEWEEISDTSIVYTIEGLEECNTYEIQVQSVCAFDTSGYTDTLVVPTFCSTSNRDLAHGAKVNIYPNPFHSGFTMDFEGLTPGDGIVELYQFNGQKVFSQRRSFAGVRQTVEVDNLQNLPPGIYMVAVSRGPQRVVRKLLKQ